MRTLNEQLGKSAMGMIIGACIALSGCASTGGGAGKPTEPGVTADAAGTVDTGSQGGKDSAGGSDVPAGQTWTIDKIQAQSTSSDCAKIVNTLPNITLSDVVVVSQLRFSTSKAGKESEGLFIQTKGGGPGSGLYLTEDKGSQADVSNAKVGSVLSIIGEVAEFFCMTEIKPKSAALSSATELPVAASIEVDLIGEKAPAASNKLYESVYVSLDNVVVSEPLGLGSDGKPHNMLVGKTEADQTLRIGAGFGIFPQTKDGKANYTKGQKLNIKGFLEYTFNVWQLTPLSITVVN